jgi:L-asparagine transporter-like permease
MFVSKVFWMGLVVSVFMLASGVLLLFVPPYAGDGLFLMLFSVMTLALVLMTNMAVTRFQRWTMDNARAVEATLALLARKSSEASKPQTAEEESFEVFEPSLVEEEKEIVEEEIPA